VALENASYWWRGTSRATFDEVPAPGGGLTIELADVDRNGLVDVLLNQRSDVEVFRNTGAWLFNRTAVIPVPSALPAVYELELGDVDGDDDFDLLVIAIAHSSLWRNNGRGGFSQDPTFVAPVTYSTCANLEDYDEDDDLDIWVGNGMGFPQLDQLYINDDTGRFVDMTLTRTQQQPMGTVCVVSADVDEDGDLDVIAQHGVTDGVLYRNHLRDVAFVHPVRIGALATVRVCARRGFAAGPQLAFPAVSMLPLARVVIPPIGSWRLSLAGLIVFPPVLISTPMGEANLTIPVPLDQALIGQTASVQAIIAHELTASSWRVSNVARATIQP
jgi:hypothetical protein